jgi:predicted RNase H-like HicB family nuclease
MEHAQIFFTAVFMKAGGGYVGFIEELPGINSSGRTLAEARNMLKELAALAFAEERSAAEALISAKDVVRETLFLPAHEAVSETAP